MSVLVLNAGSSSLKYAVVDPATGDSRLRGAVQRIGSDAVPDHDAALDRVRAGLDANGVDGETLRAVGHRVVHGGPSLTAPTVVDADVLGRIEAASRLAPLHNPPALAGIRRTQELFPAVPQVAVFDTGWFADLPPAAATYAIDVDLARREQVRRYGAHGISHQYVAARAAAFLGRPLADLAQVVLHLGSGASASASRGGRPVDTSMGLTPLAGLVMATRPGDLDPGLVLHLLRHADLDLDALEDLLHHRSGLLGLAGTSDFRDLQAAVAAGDDAARAAYDVYCHRLRSYVGAYVAVLGGVDVLTFTAGVGEHAPGLREDVLRDLGVLGIEVDPRRNRAEDDRPRRISADRSLVEVLVVPTDEELAIARLAVELLDAGDTSG